MDILRSAITKFASRVQGSGAEEGVVTIDTDPDRVTCQFEKGACLRARFGGRSAEFVTMDPLTATTRIGFMFGAPLEKLPQRAAASAILNVATGFFCISRVLKACTPDSHPACRAALLREIGGRRVYPVGMAPNAAVHFPHRAETPDEAEVIVVTGDGMIGPGFGEIVARYRGEKEILFLAPSTAGMSALQGCAHWCPFGRG